MILPDVNILLYAHKQGAPDYWRYHEWLTRLVEGDAAYGMSELVLSSFLRIATHPRIFDPPSSPTEALAFIEDLLAPANCVRINPGPRHFELFVKLVQSAKTKGNLVPDAYFAALAIESGCIWATTDRDYKRFDGLHTIHPLAPSLA